MTWHGKCARPHADDAIWMAFLASIAQPKLVPFLAHWHKRYCGNNNQKQDMAWLVVM